MRTTPSVVSMAAVFSSSCAADTQRTLLPSPNVAMRELASAIADAASAEIQRVRKEMSDALDKWIVDTKDLGEIPEKELIKRGLVRDVLSTEYDARIKLHPKTPPVP